MMLTSRRIIKYLFPDAIPMFHEANGMVGSKTPKMLIFLAGWGGSKRKNLRKLVSFYNQEGYHVITHTMPLMVPGFVREQIEEWIADEIAIHLSIINKEHQHASNTRTKSGGSFITHIYSNNGAWVYGALSARSLIPNPALVIWDSSPSLCYDRNAPVSELASGLCRVFVSNLLRRPVYTHPILTPLGTFLLSCFINFSLVILKIQGSINFVPDMVSLNLQLRDQSPVIPSVFIYSSGDKLIPSDVIREFISALRRRGVPIVEKVFGDEISHTGSFFLQPEEYMSFLKPYLENPSRD